MAYHVDVSDLAAGANESIIQLELRFVAPCFLDRFAKSELVIRMDALKERFVSRLTTVRIKTQYAVAFFGEVPDLTLGRYRCPTARVGEPLCFRQVTLASPQFFLRPLAFGGVHHRPNKLGPARNIVEGTSHNVNMLDRSIRHQQAMFKIKIL